MSRWIDPDSVDLVLDDIALCDGLGACNGEPVSYYEVFDPDDHWAALTVYVLDDVTRPTTRNGYVYRCTTGGTSGASEPVWGTIPGGTTNDGTCVWTCYLHRARINVDLIPADFTIGDGTYGRNISLAEKADNPVHTTGLINHVAFINTTTKKLKNVNVCAEKTVTEGNLETVNTFIIYEIVTPPVAFP
jgi:hypothetical protein